MSIITGTKQNFNEEVLMSLQPVLVDFWASWCGPCRMLSPVVDEIGEEYGDQIKVVKVDVDEEADLAAQYGVMSIPTLIAFKNGEIAETSVGVRPKEEILDMLEIE